MSMGRNTTPLWVDEEIIDREKRKKGLDTNVRINDLQSENEKLKSRIKELEDGLRRN